MADNDQPSRLEAATVKAEAGSQIVSDFANLPAGQTVATASGNIPTLAGVIGVIQDEGDQAAADVRAKADAQVQAAIGTLVKKAGDTMTGALTLSGAPTANLHASTKAYVDSGDAATLASAKSYTDTKPTVLAKYFESGLQDIAGNAVVTVAHGFGSVPVLIAAHIVCQTATNGYQPGDIVEFPIIADNNGANATGMTVEKNTSNLILRFGANVQSTTLISKTTPGATVNLQNVANWKLVVRAFGR